ncbi:pyridoxal-dependent decarboxylase [uncultured Thiodictyon sp.]|uniref:pyridoxal phosphate-dependent decarboxylase family protein n=1 Tax=uncultured Thiodictyon sp. TaxID=1846217 RepID=UPI0025ECA53E|nr:pyridoxal-dependent decarboxylase [uncultured Thiodictyon sp.]
MSSTHLTRRQWLKGGTAAVAALALQQRLFPNLTIAEVAAALAAGYPQAGVTPAGGLADSLAAPWETPPLNLNGVFLGPKAENAPLVESLLVEVFRDYVFWRRNFHPEDRLAITPEEQRDAGYLTFIDNFRRELFTLLGELKADIPFYSPRYLGHMTGDVSLPALVGYFATMLYDPNNVSWEASPITTLLELEVGRSLARMLGFGHTPQALAGTWGHITSGGTLANIESIWVAKALKFLPIAVHQAALDLQVNDLTVGTGDRPLAELNAWELVNLTPTAALDLKDRLLRSYAVQHPELTPDDAVTEVTEALKRHDILSLGDHSFFSRLTGNDTLQPAILCAPQTMHYSWVKGPGAIGVGARQVMAIPIDAHYRMDVARLRQQLEQALAARQPVIAVVGVVGTTEEGAVDPMHELVALRDEFAGRGLTFCLHCDAAYGGYIASCFRAKNGELRPLPVMQDEYAGWPPADVYQSFTALQQVDSATIDPHKLGYVPYPAGAIVFRDGRVKDLVAQEAAYALGGRTQRQPGEVYIGKYILEGSKPGAAAASVYLSHRVVPLNEDGYGRLLGQTLRITRTFHDALARFGHSLANEFILRPLTLPDTNILNYTFNIAGNDRLDLMNRFSLALYQSLSIDPASPVQTRQFIVSHTEFGYDTYNPVALRAYLQDEMGVQGRYFVPPAERKQRLAAGESGFDSEVVVFRTTLMNLFTLEPARGEKNYMELFLEGLPTLLRQARQAVT